MFFRDILTKKDHVISNQDREQQQAGLKATQQLEILEIFRKLQTNPWVML